MKRLSILTALFLALSLLAFGAFPAAAKEVSLGKISSTALYSACQKAGGDFSAQAGTYGCTKPNCDKKGGMCAVSCDTVSQQCNGMTPGRLVTDVTLLEFLTAAHVAPLLQASGDAGTPGNGGATGGAATAQPHHPGDLLGGPVTAGPIFGGGIQ